MFWTIVGALIFFFIILPLGISLFGWIFGEVLPETHHAYSEWRKKKKTRASEIL